MANRTLQGSNTSIIPGRKQARRCRDVISRRGEPGRRKRILRNQESRWRARNFAPAVGTSNSAATLKYDVARSAHRPSSLAHTVNPLELLKFCKTNSYCSGPIFLFCESPVGLRPPISSIRRRRRNCVAGLPQNPRPTMSLTGDRRINAFLIKYKQQIEEIVIQILSS